MDYYSYSQLDTRITKLERKVSANESATIELAKMLMKRIDDLEADNED